MTNTNGTKSANKSTRLFNPESPKLSDFKQICSRTTNPADYPLASSIAHNIPIYEITKLDPADVSTTSALQDEWYDILSTGAGVFVLKGMYDPAKYEQTLTATNESFKRIIAHENNDPTKPKGDHFAASGKNDRIWNSFGKHALDDPDSFLHYYANPDRKSVV